MINILFEKSENISGKTELPIGNKGFAIKNKHDEIEKLSLPSNVAHLTEYFEW